MLEKILKKLISKKPSVGENQKNTTERFVVVHGSVEYTHIINKFKLTMTNATNWKKFIHHKSMIELKNGGEANEIVLFHGISDIFLELIYDSEESFDM